MHWMIAIAIAACCALIEAWLSGPRPFRVLASLQQPKWALPVWGWMLVGALFYIVMTNATATALQAGIEGRVALLLVVCVLLTDGFWNYLLFRRRRLDWAYRYLFPYAALVAAATYAVGKLDLLAGLLIGCYLIFLPYDFAWSRALRQLNAV
jgi:translocator protein